jgi:hypothetical protein
MRAACPTEHIRIYVITLNNILHRVEIILHYRALTIVNDFVHRLNFKKGNSQLPKRRVFLNLDDVQNPIKRRVCQ